MQLTKPFVLFFSVALFSGALLAQGSGTTIPRTPGPDYRDSYTVTRSVTGILEELNDQGKTLRIVDEKSGQSLRMGLARRGLCLSSSPMSLHRLVVASRSGLRRAPNKRHRIYESEYLVC